MVAIVIDEVPPVENVEAFATAEAPELPQPAETKTKTMPDEIFGVLTALDDRLVEVVARGDIRLLSTSWLREQNSDFRIVRRQELAAKVCSPTPLLRPEEAVALIRRGDRCVGSLSYGWLMAGEPDPAGTRIRVVRQALLELPHIEALFWEYASRS